MKSHVITESKMETTTLAKKIYEAIIANNPTRLNLLIKSVRSDVLLSELHKKYDDKSFLQYALEVIYFTDSRDVIDNGMRILSKLLCFGAGPFKKDDVEKIEEASRKRYNDSSSWCYRSNILWQILFYKYGKEICYLIRNEFESLQDSSEIKKYFDEIVKPVFIENNVLDKELINEIINWRDFFIRYHEHLEDAIKKKAVVTELNTVLKNPKQMMHKVHDFLTKKTYFLPSLSECACESGTYDRFANTKRKDIENQILQEVYKRFEVKAQTSLNYFSLGAGYLLQDFILCSHLLIKGYALNIYLVEPDLYQSRFIEAFQQFAMILTHAAREKGLSIVIEAFKNINDFSKKYPKQKIHVANAIDFESLFKEEVFNDVMLTHSILADKGVFYLSFSGKDFFFDKNKSLIPVNKKGLENEFIKNYLNANGRKVPQVIRLVDISSCDLLNMWSVTIPTLNMLGCRELHYTTYSPLKVSYFGNPTEDKLVSFNQNNLCAFMQLFFNGKVTVKLFDSFQDFQKHILQGNTYNIINQVGVHPKLFNGKPDEENIAQIQWLFWNHNKGYHHYLPLVRGFAPKIEMRNENDIVFDITEDVSLDKMHLLTDLRAPLLASSEIGKHIQALTKIENDEVVNHILGYAGFFKLPNKSPSNVNIISKLLNYTKF